MGSQVPIDRLDEVSRIVDSCLTEETWSLLAPFVIFSGLKIEDVRKKVLVELLEHTQNELTRQLNRELSSVEVILTFNRVKQFLAGRGLY